MAAAALCLALGAGCEEPPRPPAEVIRPVRTQRVTVVGDGRVRRFSGVVRAGQESRLSFKVGGTLRALKVSIGDRVERGQLIAELDASDLRLAVQQAQAAHAQARAQVINAKANYERTRKLYESSSAAKSNLDGARAAYTSAQAAVTSATKQIQLARSQLAYARLSSPVDGAIAASLVEVNENVTPGQPVVVLQSGGAREVKITVPEVLIAQIKKGAPAEVTLDALAGQTLAATVAEVGVASESMGATYPVTLTLTDAPKAVRPGMAAEVAFRLGDAEGGGRVVVPPVAVGEDREGRFVYVAAPREGPERRATVRRRAVEVGELTTSGLEVTRGLADGDLVIVRGVGQIRDGLEVKLMAEAAR
jgi:RND family efflux transporter MFP subunit